VSDKYRSVLALHGERHWWIAGMRRVANAVSGPAQGRVLDIGCGPGWDLIELPEGVRGIGLDRSAAHIFYRPLVLGQAARLPFATATFDRVHAFDLLDQREVQPAAALLEMHRVLRPGGLVVIRVPAYAWLRGPHDEFWGGERRFMRGQLRDLVRAAGLEIHRLTYANTLFFPAAMTSRLLARAGLGSGVDVRALPDPLNRSLRELLNAEAHWLRRHDMPFGLSLLCVAERVESPR
jgi:SAM-dependent methyltransferase